MRTQKKGKTFPLTKRQKKIQLRFSSDEIHEGLKALAKEDERSLNGEIMLALRDFISHRKEVK